MRNKPDLISDDVCWGVKGERGIAAEIGRTPRQAYHLISRGALPVRKLSGRTIIASRRELREHLRKGRP